MSFQVWLQWFERGQPAGLPVASIENAFPEAVRTSDGKSVSLRFDELNQTHLRMHLSQANRATTVTLDRPCGAAALWEGVFALLALGNGVCYWPDGPMFVARKEADAHLPPDMRATLGEVVVVKSGADIAAHLRTRDVL